MNSAKNISLHVHGFPSTFRDWATDCVTRALMDTIEQKVTAGIA